MTSPSVTALMFHGLCPAMPDWATFPDSRTCLMDIEQFRRAIAWCVARFRVLHPNELEAFLAGPKPEPAVLITFDDGLRSVIDLGLPVLSEHGITPLVFVTTGWTDAGRAPAVFEVERALASTKASVLEFRLGGERRRFQLGGTRRNSKALSDVWAACFRARVPPLSLQDEDFLFDDQPWTRSEADPYFWHPATWPQLSSAVRQGAIVVGSHMEHHVPLAWLDPDGQDHEMRQSQHVLRERLGTVVDTCSYPHGIVNGDTYTRASRHYRYGFTNQRGRMTAGQSTWSAPRFHVPSDQPMGVELALQAPGLAGIARRVASYLRD